MNKEERIHHLLQGALDLHMHTAPSFLERSVDTMEAAEECCAAGMRAIAVKDHHASTFPNAYFVNKYMRKHDKPFTVFASLCLNNQMGFNASAVDTFLRLGGKLVYMPTIAAPGYGAQISLTPNGSFVPIRIHARKENVMHVLDENGELKPEVREIIDLIKKADAVLCTGHLDYNEVFGVAKYAADIGHKKVLLTHLPQFTTYDHGKLKAVVDLGGFAEMAMCLLAEETPAPFRTNPDALCELIRFLGPERCVFSTDAGSVVFPHPVPYYKKGIEMFIDHGFTDQEIERMTRENPAKLVGISV
jgi:hypothetical protein